MLKNKYIILGLFFVFLCLPACAIDDNFMTKAVLSWTGYPLDDFIAVWNYPDGQMDIANKKLYYWDIKQSIQTDYTGNSITSQSVYCRVIVETDSDNKIKGGSQKGNACPVSYILNKGYVNPLNDPWQKAKSAKKKKN